MRAGLLAVAVLLLAAAPASAAPELVEIGRFAAPVHVASPPNDPRVFVVEQGGLVKIAGGGTFIDLTGPRLGGPERGLLSIAFPPDYATSGRFYVFLTSKPDGDVEVLEYRRSATDPNIADPTTRRPVFTAPHFASNHNGGQLQFGPDGALYASIGDNAVPSNAQSLDNPYGKILRIDPITGAYQIWSSGLRNPWRFTFDRATGDMLVGDVGEVTWEEVNWARAPNAGSGVDYGWPCAEGPSGDDSCGVRPAFARNHSDGYSAIIGGYVVRDPGLPTLAGRYLYGDADIDSLRSVLLPDTGDRAEPMPISRLSSFGEDACGRLYAASLEGPVYRIQDGTPTPCSYAPPRAPATPADAAAPGLKVRILRPRLGRRRLRVAIRCSEPCRAAVATRLKRVKRLSTRRRSLAANKRTVVPLKLGPGATRKLRRALRRRGRVRLAIRVRATDAAGNRSAVTRRGRIKRRR